jgi:putative tryptophan/tyrosine transport system substrate-binding protein
LLTIHEVNGMTRREFITLLSGAAAMPPTVSRALALVWPMLGWAGGARAQTQARVPRIGYLTLAPLTDPPSPERAAFLHGLGELGYIDGKTITIEYQSGEMNVVMLPDAAAELVDRKVDLIVAAGTVACIAAKNATKSIPVVMMFSSEPVASGLVNSLARPGGNVTGLSTMQTELDAKRLEMLQEILPKISHVAVLWTTVHPSHQYELKSIADAARRLRMEVTALDVTNPSDLNRAFGAMTEARPDALFVLWDYRTLTFRKDIAAFAATNHLPTSVPSIEFVEAGGLMSYGPNQYDIFRRTAAIVDKVLKGAKPAEIPVEQPTKFELIVNMKTAKALGISMPQSILLRADRVIE